MITQPRTHPFDLIEPIPVHEVAEDDDGGDGEPPADGGGGGRVGAARQTHVEAGAHREGDHLEAAQHEHAHPVAPAT